LTSQTVFRICNENLLCCITSWNGRKSYYDQS